MTTRRITSLLLAILMAQAAASRALTGGEAALPVIWVVFLYALPLALILGLQGRARWTVLACVMYGTVGLALDISTAVQDLTHQTAGPASLVLGAVSGLANFLLIVFGGREFLDAGLWSPPADRPPNPPPHRTA